MGRDQWQLQLHQIRIQYQDSGAASAACRAPSGRDPSSSRGGRTTVTVQFASPAILDDTLPSSVRFSELCRAPTRI